MDEIAREGERKMLIEALKAEVDDYVERNLVARDKQNTLWSCATNAPRHAG